MGALSFLKNHPFAVKAHFNRSVVFTFAVPKKQLAGFLPECLTLDSFNNEYGFIAVAMVDTKNLRPKGIPETLGNDFVLIGYRVFVRYTNIKGKRLRGLYILKSETNKKRMEFFGNLFTHYNYTTTDIIFEDNEEGTKVSSKESSFQASFNMVSEESPLPEGSPFASWKEARKFMGPLPFTFTYDPQNREVLIIEGVRQNWNPQPLTVKDYHFKFIEDLNLSDVILANAFQITDVPYYWKKGVKEIWRT
jgi:hypothetical protein